MHDRICLRGRNLCRCSRLRASCAWFASMCMPASPKMTPSGGRQRAHFEAGTRGSLTEPRPFLADTSGHKLNDILASLFDSMNRHWLLVQVCDQILLNLNTCRHLCMVRRLNLGMFSLRRTYHACTNCRHK